MLEIEIKIKYRNISDAFKANKRETVEYKCSVEFFKRMEK